MRDQLRHGFRRALIYFGLAEDRDSPGGRTGETNWWTVFFFLIVIPAAVADDRDGGAALIVAAMFLPAMLLAMPAGPLPGFAARYPLFCDGLFMPPVMFAAALILFPDDEVLRPALLASVPSAVAIVGGWRRDRRDLRDAAARARRQAAPPRSA